MGQLAKATGRWTQYIHYEGTAKVCRFSSTNLRSADLPFHLLTTSNPQAYVQEWYQLALTAHDYKYPHAKLAYQDEWSSGLLCRSFRLLSLVFMLQCPVFAERH